MSVPGFSFSGNPKNRFKRKKYPSKSSKSPKYKASCLGKLNWRLVPRKEYYADKKYKRSDQERKRQEHGQKAEKTGTKAKRVQQKQTEEELLSSRVSLPTELEVLWTMCVLLPNTRFLYTLKISNCYTLTTATKLTGCNYWIDLLDQCNNNEINLGFLRFHAPKNEVLFRTRGAKLSIKTAELRNKLCRKRP